MNLTVDQILEQGITAQNNGNLQEAENFYKTILRVDPTHPVANQNIGMIFYSFGKFDEAINKYKQAIKFKPDFAEAYYNLGVALKKSNQLDKAELSYKKAIELKPNLVEAYYNLGNLLNELNRLDEAELNYKKVIKLKPDFAAAYNNLGNMLKDLNRLDEAELNYQKAIELKPDFAVVYNNFGVIRYKLNRLNEAELNYQKAIKLKPGFAAAYNNLGNTLKDLGRLDEAELNYQKAIEFEPKEAEFLLNLSIVHYYLNKLDMAISELEQLLTMKNYDCKLKATINLAIFNFLKGEKIKSKKYLLKSSNVIEKSTKDFNNFKEYHHYLSKILDWHEEGSLKSSDTVTDKKLYVIGESHSLVSHGLRIVKSESNFLCKSFLIMGCKQWHLANPNRNQYKVKFESVISSLPKSSEILLSIGEIDCRLNEGIIEHHNKNPNKKKIDLINITINDYLDYIHKINNLYDHQLTVQGVPCPNINIKDIPIKKIEELVVLIGKFNSVLKKKSVEIGFSFLDVYKLSNRGDGLSNKIWHLDNYHLSPDAMKEAWNKHLIKKINNSSIN